MKILHIGPSQVPVLSEYGGAVQRRVWGIARAQARLGHEVTVLSPSDVDRRDLREGVLVQHVRLRCKRPLRDYEFFVRARRQLAGADMFDIMHAHGSPDAVRFLANLSKVSVQSVDYFKYRLTGREVGRRYYLRSLGKYQAILPVSRYCQRELLAFYPELRVEVAPVPNGVDLRQFFPDSAAGRRAVTDLNLPVGPLVVYLGRVNRQKGSDLLGELAARLRHEAPGTTVVAVGPMGQFGGHDGSSLSVEIAAKGVVCTGAVHESRLRGVLSAAAVVVLPTRQDEMFGMAALEAIACGTPVVASDLGGIPEAVGDAGVLFPTGDAASFAEAVLSLLGDGQRLDALSCATQPHARRFAWERIEEDVATVYRRALSHV